MTKIKICGLTDSESLECCCAHHVDFIGFVFYQKSPRFISPHKAGFLIHKQTGLPHIVGLFVDPTDNDINAVLAHIRLDYIQLHGAETPARITEIKNKTDIPVIKAFRVRDQEDITQAKTYEDASDWLLFDAYSDKEQGGTGTHFDWHLIENEKFSKPWMLSGGLHADNVAEALNIAAPDAIDVSSGVEWKRGHKSPDKIKEFIETVRAYR